MQRVLHQLLIGIKVGKRKSERLTHENGAIYVILFVLIGISIQINHTH